MFADFSLFGFRRLAIFPGLFPRLTSPVRLAALALLGLAGCLKPPPPGGVRLSYYLWGDGVMAEHERRVIADFERENPGITIELTSVIGNYNEKMQALIVGGFGTAGFGNMQTTLMLTEAPIEMRSRLMGIATVGIGTGPLGVLAAGAIASEFGPRGAVLAMASLGLLATLTLVLALRRR